MELNREHEPKGEPKMIAQTVAMTEAILKGGKGKIFRGQHAKATGAARARLIVNPDRRPETRKGIFEHDGEYDGFVRFSNGVGRIQPDWAKDARGMAIKVKGVSGPRPFEEEGEDRDTQDFIMINHPVFAFKDVKEYRNFHRLRLTMMRLLGQKGLKLAPLLFFVFGHPIRFVKVASKLAKPSKSPLAETYWSMSSYMLGDRAIKFQCVPAASNSEGLPDAFPGKGDSDDILSERFLAHVAKHGAKFDLRVQFQSDPVKTPVEDPTVEWKESESPFSTVATLVIEPGAAITDGSVEKLSFNPWHTLTAHRPLGGLNRVRKTVYLKSTQLRLDAKNQALPDPKS